MPPEIQIIGFRRRRDEVDEVIEISPSRRIRTGPMIDLTEDIQIAGDLSIIPDLNRTPNTPSARSRKQSISQGFCRPFSLNLAHIGQITPPNSFLGAPGGCQPYTPFQARDKTPKTPSNTSTSTPSKSRVPPNIGSTTPQRPKTIPDIISSISQRPRTPPNTCPSTPQKPRTIPDIIISPPQRPRTPPSTGPSTAQKPRTISDIIISTPQRPRTPPNTCPSTPQKSRTISDIILSTPPNIGSYTPQRLKPPPNTGPSTLQRPRTPPDTVPSTPQTPRPQTNWAIGTLPRTALRADTLDSPTRALQSCATSTPRRTVRQTQSPCPIFNIPGLSSNTTNRLDAFASPHQAAKTNREVELETISHKGHTLRAKKTVELRDGTFLRIASIKNRISGDGDSRILFEGSRFKRAREFMGLIGPKQNEVAMSSLSEIIPYSEVLRPRILILTNAPFPRYRDVEDNKSAEVEGRLICRWRINIVNKQEGYIWRLDQHEVDKEYRTEDSELRENWRGSLVDVVRILEKDNPPRQHEQDFFGEDNFVDLTVGKPKDHAGVQEHHTEIVTKSSSLELNQTSYESLGSSYYKTTIDSSTPAGRFLGYFRGTYTPYQNTLPGTSFLYQQSKPLESQVPSAPQTPNKPSGTSLPPAGNMNDWRSKHGLSNNLCTPLSSKSMDPFNNHLSTPKRHGLFPLSTSSQNTPTFRGLNKDFSKSHAPLEEFGEFMQIPPPPRPIFDPASHPSARRKYKFGDAFCGGGGMSSGARSAGLENTWSFDFNLDAVTTYRSNFPDCDTYHLSVNDFVKLPPEDLLVDIVHLSPPCQPHSPAHTVAGKDDDRNEASLFCVESCLNASRPRMVTLEQTDGLLNRPEWFRSLVMSFTDLGFSVSWKVLHGVEYGVPQTRKRLFVLAASPGEPLPNFPAPKYARPTKEQYPNTRLPPARTVRNAIGHIPYGTTCHNRIWFPNGYRLSTVDFDQPLKATILASGGPYDVHPSGLRPFTPRELACLQTFPVTHYFAGSSCQKKRQIGNAVPPMLSKALLREVRRILEKVDRERSKVSGGGNSLSKAKNNTEKAVVSIPDDEQGDSSEIEILKTRRKVLVVD